jgi:hypothetical protein
MRLTQTLLGYLNRVFNKDPGQFLAFRMQYSGGGMSWQVADGFLTVTVPPGGVGQSFTVDLSTQTLQSLITLISGEPGFTVPFSDPTRQQLSALVLLDGSNSQAASNGDHLYAYTSLLWAFFEACSNELELAETQIDQLPQQMSIPTADDFWLDFIGNLYGIQRGTIVVNGVSTREPSPIYGPRIIQEVLAPRGNNIAIQMAIQSGTGNQQAVVTDAPITTAGTPHYDSSISYNGAHLYNVTTQGSFGLFDVQTGFNLEGSENITDFENRVKAIVERFRDAGTHLRSITLAPSTLTDTATDPTDSASLTVFTGTLYSGRFNYDGTLTYGGGSSETEAL